MTTDLASKYGATSKYGAALTGSDWPGLPLRIGHIPESGRIEALSTNVDALLIWSGGPAEVTISFADPRTQKNAQHRFLRSSGMIDLLPRGTLMHFVEWRGKASTCTSVNLPDECVRKLCPNSLPGLDHERGPEFGLVDTHIVDLVQRLQAQADGREYLGAVYVQSLSLALASYVSARYGAVSERALPVRPASLSAVQRTQIKGFVEREIGTNFSLVDLAEQVGYSPDHFSRLFKHTFEQSPHQYVLSRRIERAMNVLRDETLSIAEVAASCGFSSQGHFTTVFKQRTGTTPGAYRRDARARF